MSVVWILHVAIISKSVAAKKGSPHLDRLDIIGLKLVWVPSKVSVNLESVVLSLGIVWRWCIWVFRHVNRKFIHFFLRIRVCFRGFRTCTGIVNLTGS